MLAVFCCEMLLFALPQSFAQPESALFIRTMCCFLIMHLGTARNDILFFLHAMCVAKLLFCHGAAFRMSPLVMSPNRNRGDGVEYDGQN